MGQKHRCFEEEVSSRTKMLRELVFIRELPGMKSYGIYSSISIQ